MKTRLINVGEVEDIEVLDPENMEDIRRLTSDRRDLFHLASRGFDQCRRSYLMRVIKRGESERFVRDAARDYHYHRGTRLQ
ncbi:hypothetical protein LCGC14_2053880 [marine sediment metagenome]|uniref:Uncharacterized protein n=1 Tax=marine sediment metagenome TaxID=412755 RepID=A0A0F9ENB0_9ZZZZ